MEPAARQISARRRRHDRAAYRALGPGLHRSNLFLSIVCAGSVIAGAAGAALADYRIRKDYGGFIDQYKLKYAAIRDRGERVIIDGVCNSACTLVLGIVPLNRICATPRASLGFHTAYIDKSFTFGIKVTNYWATADMLAGDSEEMDRRPRRAHRRHEDGEERPRTLGHHRSVPGGSFLSGVCRAG
jgi:hypothetical protein